MPTLEIAVMLSFMAAALVLFAREILPIEVTAMSMLAALLLVGFVTAEEAITGFSNKAVVTIGAMLVLSQALVKTGLPERLADRIAAASGPRPWLAVGVLLAAAGVLSGFLNNTAVVAMFIPLLSDLCRRFRVSPTSVLMPLSYASIAGGTLTLIGSSTNLLVSAIAEDHGLSPIGMFELTPMGVIFLVAGLAYVLIAAPRLLPARAMLDDLTQQYEMRPYLTELLVQPGSRLAGKTIDESAANRRFDVTVLEVRRGGERIVRGLAHLRLQAGDRLLVRGALEGLLRMRREEGVALLSDVKLSAAELQRQQTFVEALVGPSSPLIGKTLADINFRQRTGAFVLAIRREGKVLHEKVARIPLQFADDLLLVAPKESLGQLHRTNDIIIISEKHFDARTGASTWVTLLVLPAVVLSAAVGVIDILPGALLGTVFLFALRIVTPYEVYRSLDWSVLIMIACFVPVGLGMENTGTAAFLAAGIGDLQTLAPELITPPIVLMIVYLTTSLLTETISNNASAILIAPIAIQVAGDLGIDARPLLMAVCFASSAAFMTPHGYQTNLMVYGPGGYRFLDYVKLGAPMNLFFLIIASLLIPLFWEL